MSVQEIESAIHRLSRPEVEQLRAWLEEYLEDQLELADRVKDALDQSRREIAEGKVAGKTLASKPDFLERAKSVWGLQPQGTLLSELIADSRQ